MEMYDYNYEVYRLRNLKSLKFLQRLEIDEIALINVNRVTYEMVKLLPWFKKLKTLVLEFDIPSYRCRQSYFLKLFTMIQKRCEEDQ